MEIKEKTEWVDVILSMSLKNMAVVCESPFEIEQDDSRATGLAAEIVLQYYHEQEGGW